MITWWWVRHGPTHEKAFVGWRDVAADLSDTALIARVADFLPSDAAVVSSDLIRASATADAIQRERHRLDHAPDLREFNLGDWDGKTFNEVAKTHPDLSRAYWETPGEIAPPNGESWNSATSRITAYVDAQSAKTTHRHVIAVAHIGVILTQLQRALGVTPYQVLGQHIDNFSVTSLTFDGADWSADLINHLP